ncbi:MAG: serine/threonine-protein phosphatase [Frankia sp.]|nr:serine/threonine-protein phosphatase [Frankia sp.]
MDGAGAQAADEEPNAAAPAEGGPESVDGLEELASAPDGEVVVEQLISTGPLLSSIVAGPGVWRTGRLRLHAGDVLFVYTDGLVEARDADGRLFGQQRLVEELTRVAGRSPERLLADVFAAVRRYSPGRPSDDRTAIALSLARSDGERPPGGAAVDTTPAHPDGTDWRAPWQPPAEATH